MAENLMSTGVELMLIGMGTVFVFLTMLVGATSLMSYLVNRFAPEPEPLLRRPAPSPAVTPQTTTDEELVAVISAAIKKHSSRHK